MKLPLPEIVPAKVVASLRSKAKMPLFTIEPANAPFVVPSPTCSVEPLEMAVCPLKPEESLVSTVLPFSILILPAPNIAGENR